jgi:hypothetical protein
MVEGKRRQSSVKTPGDSSPAAQNGKSKDAPGWNGKKGAMTVKDVNGKGSEL